MTDKAKQKMISLYDADEARVHQIGKDHGISSFSATLRWLINDWKRMKMRETTAIIAGTPIRINEQAR